MNHKGDREHRYMKLKRGFNNNLKMIDFECSWCTIFQCPSQLLRFITAELKFGSFVFLRPRTTANDTTYNFQMFSPCTPTNPCHNPHERVLRALFVGCRSIYEDN